MISRETLDKYFEITNLIEDEANKLNREYIEINSKINGSDRFIYRYSEFLRIEDGFIAYSEDEGTSHELPLDWLISDNRTELITEEAVRFAENSKRIKEQSAKARRDGELATLKHLTEKYKNEIK